MPDQEIVPTDLCSLCFTEVDEAVEAEYAIGTVGYCIFHLMSVIA